MDIATLLASPRERLAVEHKSWLDLNDQHARGVLAKALIALANFGGGHVVLGIRENGPERAPETRPDEIAKYTTEIIAGVVRKFIDPVFECDLEHVIDPESGIELAVLTVPGGIPDVVMSKSGIPDGPITEFRAYVRKPGPASEAPTSIAEWRTLFDRCVKARQGDMLDAIRAIVTGAPNTAEGALVARPDTAGFAADALDRWQKLIATIPADHNARFKHGYWTITAALQGNFTQPTLSELHSRLLTTSQVNHSGWPPFVFLQRDPFSPSPIDGAIQSWVYEEGRDDRPSHQDFWRVSASGLAYMMRGYQEDGFDELEPGTGFDITTPTWRLGEVVLFLARLGALFDGVDAVQMAVRYVGLRGRELVSYGNPNRWVFPHRKIQQDEYSAEATFNIAEASDTLPEIVFSLLAPLYELFGFFELPRALVSEELASMRRNRF